MAQWIRDLFSDTVRRPGWSGKTLFEFEGMWCLLQGHPTNFYPGSQGGYGVEGISCFGGDYTYSCNHEPPYPSGFTYDRYIKLYGYKFGLR